MTGGRAGRGPRTVHSARAAGVAAVALFVLALLLYGSWPVALDAFVPLPLPRTFWVLLALILAVGAIAFLSISEGAPRYNDRVRSAAPTWPDPERRLEGVADSLTLDEPIGPTAAGVSAPASVSSAAARAEPEISQILQWLEAVEAEISQWTVEIKESMAPPPTFDEPGPSRLEVAEDREPSGTVGWTERSARAAIERYLRKRPWAPATDIAKALGMNLGLAARVAESVRDEGGTE